MAKCKNETFVLTLLFSLFFWSELAIATLANEPIQIAQDSEASSVKAMRAEAERLINEATQLYQQGTPTSLQTALVRFKTALDLCRELDDLRCVAPTLFVIGLVYSDLGELEKAINYYNQALPVSQEVDDFHGEATILRNLGLVYSNLGELEKALNYYNQALPIYQKTSDLNGKAITLNNLGLVYSNLGELEKALNYYNQALPIYQKTSDLNGKANFFRNIGLVYSRLGQSDKALNYYNQALPIYQETGDLNGKAITLNNLGLVYSRIEQPEKALDYYNQALAIYREVKNSPEEATTLRNLGDFYLNTSKPEKALDYYTQALAIYQETGDLNSKAITLNNFGLVYSDLGQPEKALNYYNQALLIYREAKDLSGEAVTLNALGKLNHDIGQLEKALNYLNQALVINREVKDLSGEATTLNNLGLVYSWFGQPEKALNYLNQALVINREIKDRSGEATTLNNLGLVYSWFGQPEHILEYLKQALQIYREISDLSKEAIALSNLGFLYSRLGQPEEALNYLNQALPIHQETKSRLYEATTLNHFGDIYLSIGQPEEALNYLNRALPIHQETKSRLYEADTFYNLGRTYDVLGQSKQSLNYYNQALLIHREMRNPFGKANILSNIAILEKNRGNLTDALTNIQASIAILETIRGEIKDSDLRTTYFASVNSYYQLYIDILMELHQQNPNDGYDKQALEVSEQARSRTLLELIKEGDIVRGIDPQLKQRKEDLEQQIIGKTQAIQSLAEKGQQEQIKPIRQKISQLENQLQALEAEIRQQNPEYARLTQVRLNLNAENIQEKIVDDDTVMLSYWLGEEQSYLWLVTPNEIFSYILPPKAEIEAVTAEIIGYAQDAGWVQYPKKATAANQKLSQMLLAPVAEKITNKRLIVVADGGLQYIPFSLLENPQTNQSLIAANEIVNLPSASTLDAIRNKTTPPVANQKEVAIFAHPVFTADDPRLPDKSEPTNSDEPETLDDLVRKQALTGSSLNPLPGTEAIAQQILAYVPGSNNKKLNLGFDANRQAIFDPAVSQYRLIHLGTHGLFNKEKPEHSGIVLSLYDEQGNYQADGMLLITEVFNLNLPADLVVLAACNTVEGEEVKGEGIIGITRGLMYAGAERVLMTLWDVDDDATTVFMSRFYQEMLENQLAPAAALRATQLWMQTETEYQAPDYWAGFVLQGEWQ